MWHAWTRGDMHTGFVGNAEGKKPLGRTRRRRENNITMDLQEVGRGHELTNPAQDRDKWRALANTVNSLLFP